MIAYSAFGRGSNYELISSTIDGEISAISQSRDYARGYATPLAYIIKTILIRDAITHENAIGAFVKIY